MRRKAWFIVILMLAIAIDGASLVQAQTTDSMPPVVFRNQEAPLGRKLLRAELIAVCAQGATTGMLFAMPESYTNWSRDSMRYKFKRAWTHPPVFDHDSWTFNYVAHPYTGAFMYNAMRSQGAKPLPSFLFATGQSLIWEFLIESSFEQPSIQDLIITSNVGSLLGEGIHQLTLRMRRNGFRFMEKVFVVLANPSYAINNGFK